MKIHVVLGIHDFESSTPIKSFKDLAKAEEFLNQCKEYEDTEPELERIADCRMIGLLKYSQSISYKAHKEWENKHPAGSIYFDCYEIADVELVE